MMSCALISAALSRAGPANSAAGSVTLGQLLADPASPENVGLKKTKANATAERDEAFEERDAARILNQQLIRQINSLEAHEAHSI